MTAGTAPAPWAPLVGVVERARRVQVRCDPLASWLLLAAYAGAVAVIVPRHEPWFDEAQAWLLARDSTLWELLAERLRYEGHPGLWYLILFLPARLGLPYASMQVIAAVLAVAGVAVLVRWSPFPLPVKAGLLFSFVIGYQYAVVARSYVLVPLLLFLLARLYPVKTERVGAFTVLLVLLANVSVHGLLIACSLAVLHAADVLRVRRDLDAATWRRTLAAGGAFALVVGLVGLQLLPPADLVAGGEWHFDAARYATVVPLFVNSALTGHPLLSAVVVVLSAAWFRRTRTLLLWALPTLALASLAALKYFNLWHDGLPFLVWVFALWVSWERTPAPGRAGGLVRLGALVAVASVLVVHATYWARSYAYDYAHAYSGAPAAAAHIAEEGLHRRTLWARGFHSLAVLPYFEENVFANLHRGRPEAYWVWSARPPLADSLFLIRTERPEYVLWGVKFADRDSPPRLDGYERVATFPGGLYWKNRVMEQDGFVLLRRTR